MRLAGSLSWRISVDRWPEAELERELGRKARPFSLDFVLLPVRDDQVRPIGPDRYLVPEGVCDGPRWPELLRGLLIPRA